MDLPSERSDERSNFVALILEARRTWMLIVALVLGVAVTFVLRGVLAKREYSVQVLFYPASGRTGAAGVAGLAAQFGVDLGGTPLTQNPAFYADLPEAHAFRAVLAAGRYRLATGESAVGLAEALQITESDSAQLHHILVRRIGKMVAAEASLATGIVSLSVVSRDSVLSYGLATRAVAVLDSIVTAAERQSAVRDYGFMADRLQIAEAELTVAEDKLAHFWQTNRQIDQSPLLLVEKERLERTLRLKQDILTVVAQASERARLDGARDTPRLVVIQAPYVPLRPESRRLFLRLISGLMIGSISVFALLVARVWARQALPEVARQIGMR